MDSWYSFIAFGLCLGMAISSFIDQNWGTGIFQILMGCINLPFMVTTR